MIERNKLSQFFTPAWAAEFLYNKHFSHLTGNDLVWEPSCGPGSFLSAIPHHIPAFGSDIDPALVQKAHNNTNRPVYCGDFRYIQIDQLNRVTAIIGNPPFNLKVFEEFMIRCENILALGNKAGFILPAYFFQTARTFMRFARKWDISQEIIPVDLFKSDRVLSKPLIFASFIRDNFPQLIGFSLHKELCDVNALDKQLKEMLNHQIKRKGSIWRQVLINVVNDAGGTVTLDQVYKKMEGKRPTENPFWKDQIRKLIQQAPFKRVDNATYQLN